MTVSTIAKAQPKITRSGLEKITFNFLGPKNHPLVNQLAEKTRSLAQSYGLEAIVTPLHDCVQTLSEVTVVPKEVINTLDPDTKISSSKYPIVVFVDDNTKVDEPLPSNVQKPLNVLKKQLDRII